MSRFLTIHRADYSEPERYAVYEFVPDEENPRSCEMKYHRFSNPDAALKLMQDWFAKNGQQLTMSKEWPSDLTWVEEV